MMESAGKVKCWKCQSGASLTMRVSVDMPLLNSSLVYSSYDKVTGVTSGVTDANPGDRESAYIDFHCDDCDRYTTYKFNEQKDGSYDLIVYTNT